MVYRFGIFDFDVESGELRKNARPLPLERQPARVLAVLLERAGELVTRDELRESVWDRGTHVDFDRGLAYCLSHIRAVLGDRGDNPRFIQTFPKRGYKFIAPVTAETFTPGRPEGRHYVRVAEGVHDVRVHHRLHDVRVSRFHLLAAALLVLLLLGAWFFVNRRPETILVAVSVFDNETGVAEYDRPIAGLSDLVVTNLANLAPERLAVIGNAEVLRRPRNIRNLKAVAEGVHADYVLLGQLQQGEAGLRFVTHFIRLSDMAHLKATRVPLTDNGITGLEGAVVTAFERAAREHLLTEGGN
jgi:DNA-binding winged helix-turn-helix (wHTH) protein/TolB-like protein